jgi:hypothetical protein
MRMPACRRRQATRRTWPVVAGAFRLGSDTVPMAAAVLTDEPQMAAKMRSPRCWSAAGRRKRPHDARQGVVKGRPSRRAQQDHRHEDEQGTAAK